jgi:hypothetical protein
MGDRRLVGGSGYRGLDGDRQSATSSSKHRRALLLPIAPVHSNSHGFAARHRYLSDELNPGRGLLAMDTPPMTAAGKAHPLAVFPGH